MKYIYLIIISFLSVVSFAQTLITEDGTDHNVTANANAILELRSITNDKGMLLPRVSLSALNLPAPFSSHVLGMTVYNINTAGTGNAKIAPGLYYNDGSQWSRVVAQIPVIGDVKYSASTSDHQGWYLLNGRLLTTLPATAQTNAVSLGFATNLPNSDDRFLKAKTGAEVLGALGGNSSITLTQSNLPAVTFTGTAAAAGAHTHSQNDRGIGSVTSVEVNEQSRADDLNNPKTTNSAGAHTHTFSVSTGGTATPIGYEPPYLVTNIFVYLGN